MEGLVAQAPLDGARGGCAREPSGSRGTEALRSWGGCSGHGQRPQQGRWGGERTGEDLALLEALEVGGWRGASLPEGLRHCLLPCDWLVTTGKATEEVWALRNVVELSKHYFLLPTPALLSECVRVCMNEWMDDERMSFPTCVGLIVGARPCPEC